MIYLITGVPGSGKTLYAVSTLVQQLAAQKIKLDDGTEVTRRVCIDGIPDLLIPHETMAPLKEDAAGNLVGEGDSLANWFDWVRPGDVVVVDEVQRYWRPRGMGTKPPNMIKALETHRHKGVDFVLITQNPMLIDQNVRRLVGRHQHVRRLFGMQRAIIYDWDGCSANLSTKASTASSYFSYPPSAFKLYKSSELHTKQKQKIPLWVVVPLLALAGGLAVAPQAYSTIVGVSTGKGVAVASGPVTPGVVGNSLPAAASVPSLAASAPLAPLVAELPQNFGCIAVRNRCGCFDPTGAKVEVPQDVCLANVGANDTPKAVILDDRPVSVLDASELDAIAFSFKVSAPSTDRQITSLSQIRF